MQIFNHCWKAICNESNKCHVFIDKESYNVNNSTDENFELPAKRLAYMYKFGIYNAHFFKKCMMRFAAEYPQSLKVISEIKSSKNICSMSVGPGTDIIGLLVALKDFGYTLEEDVSFKIVNKHGAWRNTMKLLTSVENSEIPMYKNYKLLQCDVLNGISPKVMHYLKVSDVLLMDRSFASQKVQKKDVIKALKIILQFLKPGAYVFLIDTKVKLEYFKSMHLFGSYIFGPLEIQIENIPFNEEIAGAVGERPRQSGKSYFGVWRKNMVEFESIDQEYSALVNVVPANYQSQSSSLAQQLNIPSTPPKHSFTPLPSEDKLAFKEILSNQIKTDIEDPKNDVSDKKLSNNNNEPSISNAGINLLNDLESTHVNELKPLLKNFEMLITRLENVSFDLLKRNYYANYNNQIQTCSNCCCNCQGKHSNDYNYVNFQTDSDAFNYCHQTNNGTYSNEQTSMFNSVNGSNYQKGPHIVIPLRNLNSEQTAHVLSLAVKK